jgi:hypothetical protein
MENPKLKKKHKFQTQKISKNPKNPKNPNPNSKYDFFLDF